ncbi:TPA: hypothetical protein ACPUHY_002673 [Klebsiella pneumoniae]
MTSKLTREERVQALYDLKVGQVLSLADIENVKMLSRMALAAMDSDSAAPVAEVVSIYGDPEAFGEREIRPLVGIQQMPYGTKLYRHAQPAPEYPETLPCPVLLEPGLRFGKGVKTILVLEAIQRRAEHYAELEAMPPEERAEYDAGIEAFKAMLPQSAPAVPEKCPAEIRDLIASHSDALFNDDDAQEIWNACRAAMLNGGKS